MPLSLTKAKAPPETTATLKTSVPVTEGSRGRDRRGSDGGRGADGQEVGSGEPPGFRGQAIPWGHTKSLAPTHVAPGGQLRVLQVPSESLSFPFVHDDSTHQGDAGRGLGSGAPSSGVSTQ